jgi:NAD(P)-dependent dehydrogenase (short-subunit alcohol dehydrogenase family)
VRELLASRPHLIVIVNIQANAMLPGWVDTGLTQRARQEIDGLHDKVLARTPAARWGASSDFAGVAVLLASSGSDFVTGTAIPIDGGFAAMGQMRKGVRCFSVAPHKKAPARPGL